MVWQTLLVGWNMAAIEDISIKTSYQECPGATGANWPFVKYLVLYTEWFSRIICEEE